MTTIPPSDSSDIPSDTTDWLTVTEAAQRVGRSTKTIHRRIDDGRLVAQRSGPGERAPWLISSSSLEDTFGTVAAEVMPAVTTLAKQLDHAMTMLNDANRRSLELMERAAKAEAENQHLRERLGAQRTAAPQPTPTPQQGRRPRRRWWQALQP